MKKLISMLMCIALVFSIMSTSVLSASASEAAEKAQPFFYFETGVDVMYVYFFIEDAAGIAQGEFSLKYDSSVFSCSTVEQAYNDRDNYIFSENTDTVGEVKIAFAFRETCPVEELDVCVMQLKIVGDVSEISYAEMSGFIDDVTFDFEPYPIEIIYLYYGDVDFDQKVTAADARLVLRASVGLEQFSETQVMLGDVDENGVITAADARMILRHSVGLE